MDKRSYYKAMALNALIVTQQGAVDNEDCSQQDLVDKAARYADLMTEEDGFNELSKHAALFEEHCD